MSGEVASVWTGGPQVTPPGGNTDAANITYTGNGIQAITYNVQDRLRTEYWLQDYYDLADGDDWSPAMIRAIAAASSVNAGAVIKIPAGEFKFFSQINITWPNSSSIGPSRVTIEGQGMGLTFIRDWRAVPSLTQGLFAVDFSADLNSRYFQCEFGNMTIQRMVNPTTFTAPATYVIGTGIAISLNKVVMPGRFYNMQIYNYNIGILGTDTLGATFDHIHIQFADIGIKLLMGTFAPPNITSFNRCLTAGCRTFGHAVYGGSPVNFNGCTYEGCGDITLTSGALYYDYDTVAPSGVNVIGCYFEGNRGIADIGLSNSTGVVPNIANNISGCMFTRTDGTYFTTNNIVAGYNGTPGGSVKLSVRGCGFNGFGTYVPNAAHIYVVAGGINSASVSLNIDNGNFFGSPTETPASGGVGATTLDAVLAAGNASTRTAQVGQLQIGGTGAAMTASGSNIIFDGVVAIGGGTFGGIGPVTDGTQYVGGSTLRFAGMFTRSIIVGNSGAAEITGSGNNLLFNNTVIITPAVGLGPLADNVYILGTPSLRWQTGYFSSASISSSITWGGIVIPQPPGGTTNFLRSDGTWAAPSGSSGSNTLNAVLTAGNVSTLSMTVGGITLQGGGQITPSGSNIIFNGTCLAAAGTLGGLGPTVDNTYFLGNGGLRWKNLFTYTVDAATQLTVGSGGAAITASGSNLILNGVAVASIGAGFGPMLDNTYLLGSPTLRWNTVYAVTGTINTSDMREKQSIQESDLGLAFINSLTPVSYKWKGANVGTFYGLIAQDVKQSLQKFDVKDFAGWTLANPADPDSMQGLRYTEFIAPLIKAIQELAAEVAILKAAK